MAVFLVFNNYFPEDRRMFQDVKKGYQCDDCADREEGREVS